MQVSKILKRNRSFLKHIGTLMSAKAIAAAIALLITPVIARLFDPSDFGVAAVWVSLCTLLSHLSSLKYEVAIMLPAEEDEADHLYSLALRILLISVTVIAVISVFVRFLPFGNSSDVGEQKWDCLDMTPQSCWAAVGPALTAVCLCRGSSFPSGVQFGPW